MGLVESANSPMLATGVGLVLYGMQNESETKSHTKMKAGLTDLGVGDIVDKVKDYWNNHFK